MGIDDVHKVSVLTRGHGLIENADATALKALNMDLLVSCRKPRNFKGRLSNIGYFWFSKTSEMLLYESRLEAFAYLQLDFDLNVTQILPQPFRHSFRHEGRWKHHFPDILCARPRSVPLVVDVKPAKYVQTSRNQIAFDSTRRLCHQLGWEYAVWTEGTAAFQYNMRLLGGFRKQPIQFQEIAPLILRECKRGEQTIASLAEVTNQPFLVRPVLFHLLWKQVLSIDLMARLHQVTPVTINRRAHNAE